MTTCDFCLNPLSRPGWLYPCRDFAVAFRGDRSGVLLPPAVSMGPWRACSACHALIAAGDHDALQAKMLGALLRRSEPTFERYSPAQHAQVAPIAEQVLHGLLTCFLANRLGPPSLIAGDG